MDIQICSNNLSLNGKSLPKRITFRILSINFSKFSIALGTSRSSSPINHIKSFSAREAAFKKLSAAQDFFILLNLYLIFF